MTTALGPAPASPRARRRRADILARAERLFAERGFEATRLEDIALDVGIRRASIVYYFPDKRALYDAVLAQAIAPIERAIAAALQGDGAPRERVERCVGAWVDAVAARPTFVQLLLREMASSPDVAPPALARHVGGIDRVVRAFVRELRARGDGFPSPLDPASFADAIVGATVFRLTPLARVVRAAQGDHDDDPARHRREVLRITRRLLAPDAGDAHEDADERSR